MLSCYWCCFNKQNYCSLRKSYIETWDKTDFLKFDQFKGCQDHHNHSYSSLNIPALDLECKLLSFWRSKTSLLDHLISALVLCSQSESWVLSLYFITSPFFKSFKNQYLNGCSGPDTVLGVGWHNNQEFASWAILYSIFGERR